MTGRRQAQRPRGRAPARPALLHLRGRRGVGARRRGALADRRLVPGDRARSTSRSRTTGAPALLLEHFAGRLEYHDPLHRNREVSHLFRGLVDAFEADALLAPSTATAGCGWSTTAVPAARRARRPAAVRAYHLVPAGASKAGGVARHRRARGYAREDCIAVGDSREDLAVAPHVGTFWLVANAVERDPTHPRGPAGRNVRVTEAATARASTRRSSRRSPSARAPAPNQARRRAQPGRRRAAAKRDRRRRDRRAHERDPVVERQLAVDQARQAGGHRRLDPRALQRAASSGTDSSASTAWPMRSGISAAGDALGQQLARAAVARSAAPARWRRGRRCPASPISDSGCAPCASA